MENKQSNNSSDNAYKLQFVTCDSWDENKVSPCAPYGYGFSAEVLTALYDEASLLKFQTHLEAKKATINWINKLQPMFSLVPLLQDRYTVGIQIVDPDGDPAGEVWFKAQYLNS